MYHSLHFFNPLKLKVRRSGPRTTMEAITFPNGPFEREQYKHGMLISQANYFESSLLLFFLCFFLCFLSLLSFFLLLLCRASTSIPALRSTASASASLSSEAFLLFFTGDSEPAKREAPSHLENSDAQPWTRCKLQ